MIEAVIGGLVGFLLGAFIIVLWMRARSRTDAARIAELESRTEAFERAVEDKVRAESALEHLRLSSQHELEFAKQAHEAALDDEKSRAQFELEIERDKFAAMLRVEREKADAELEAEKHRAAAELEAEKPLRRHGSW